MSGRVLRPARQVCKLCGRDDDVTTKTLAPGLWSYHCAYCSFEWHSSTAVDDGLADAEGITAELGLYDDLPKCLVPGEPFVEYGIVEYRYERLRPKVFAQLLERYGHVRIAPKHYTTSVFIAMALGWLRDRGEVLCEWGPATGSWDYNGIISYWALPPGPGDGARTSWLEFARREGVAP